jgi:hypothetical protein
VRRLEVRMTGSSKPHQMTEGLKDFHHRVETETSKSLPDESKHSGTTFKVLLLGPGESAVEEMAT